MALVAWVDGWPFGTSRVLGPAPGPSAATDTWTTGDKDAIGTAFERTSPVWFTAVHGAIADVLYPQVDQDNVRQFGYLVTDGSTFVFDETTDGAAVSRVTDHRVLTYETTVSDVKHGFSLVHEFATDPARPVVLERTKLVGHTSGLHVYAYLVPHLRDSGLGQSAGFDGRLGWVTREGRWLVAGGASSGLRAAGFQRRNDGLVQLRKFQLASQYSSASDGRVTLTWEVAATAPWTEGLAFGSTRSAAEEALNASLATGFDSVLSSYRSGWAAYASGLDSLDGRAPDLWYYSAEVIKMAEDKHQPGAIVASLALPWGEWVDDDPRDVGYRKVWPRDLYHAARGLLAAGDAATVLDIARFMKRQQRPDGSMPQNTDLTGIPIWPGQQLDETADAILLSKLLADRLPADQRPDIAAAASYIAAHGPATGQERWEENSGWSPSTIASEIAALRAAGRTDLAAAWDAGLEGWTYTSHGWYVRIAPNGHPDAFDDVTIANGGGVWPQQSITDPSFLELVRLGVRGAKDPHILSTLAARDAQVPSESTQPFLYGRYTKDGYGERYVGGSPPGMGHDWPLLTGERGVYTVLAGGDASGYAAAMASMAGNEGLIPEQVWPQTAMPTGSARPLVWAHAEFIILERAVLTGVVADRG
ncbi:MAG TPA: glycoside hydrolase family 15 protein [Candidatus Dormibacteraeota bacterium]|nr:glycoside hydrolase family 15 protein [Candidatus Dormibacteraeota bacterium]